MRISENGQDITEVTSSARMRERVTVVAVCLSVCHFFILEKAPFSGLKLTSVHSRFKSFKCSIQFYS